MATREICSTSKRQNFRGNIGDKEENVYMVYVTSKIALTLVALVLMVTVNSSSCGYISLPCKTLIWCCVGVEGANCVGVEGVNNVNGVEEWIVLVLRE